MPKFRRMPADAVSRAATPADVRQQGLRAFQNGRLDEAVRLWTPLAEKDEQVRLALAEAHFRRALKAGGADDLRDVRAAAALAPADLRYQYHLGLRLHAANDLAAASAHYRAVIAGGGPAGAALLLALAALEQNPRADLAALPGSTPNILALLAPAQALLNRQPLPDTSEGNFVTRLRRVASFGQPEAEAVASLWRGLAQVGAGDGSAAATLSDQNSLPNARLTAIRRAYRGVAAAQKGDVAAALALWQQVYSGGIFTAALLDNIAAALHTQLAALLAADDLAGAATLALQSAAMPLTAAALNELRVQVLDRAAHAAAAEGAWPRAAELWEAARQLVAATAGLGSPRPLWHNLALAQEAQEQWLPAAEAWRGMLRTQPRKRSATPADTLGDAQWAWVRARVIECYKRAGRPDEAVTVFKQMIKAEPSDLHLRLQLADALLGNEQEQAALNEVQRILKIDPHFADAQLRYAMLMDARGYWDSALETLRAVAAQHPAREDVRRTFTQMLLRHAGRYIGHGADQIAETLLREGQQIEPENYQFPLSLARMYFNINRPDAARTQLARVLELAGDKIDSYLNIFQCWLVEENLDEARAIIARAEALKPPPQFYIQAGTMAINEATPPPPMFSPFLFSAPPKAPPPTDTPWTAFARELFDRALALRPDDGQIPMAIAAGVLGPRPDIALRYAEQAARLLPDDANVLIMRGLTLGLNERVREAKDQLRKAANQARKQGDAALAAHADELRREVSSPMFRAAFQMRAFMPEGDGLEELFFE